MRWRTRCKGANLQSGIDGEAEHRDVNHAVSGVPDNMVNPLYDPRQKMDVMLKKYVEDMMEKEANKHVESPLKA
jgi:hypothetical protein